MRFETHGVLSASTGILMGDIGAVYAVASYLLDRPAYTHELAYYSERIAKALRVCHPELPSDAPDGTWQAVRDDFIARHGEKMELDAALKGVLADDKDPVTTLREMGFKGEIIAVKPGT
jgi:hypothetical protein